MSLIMGVDPGLTGALAVIEIKNRRLVDVIDTPLIKHKTKKSKIDPTPLSMFIDEYAKDCIAAVVEEVSAMPNQGVTSSFRFGMVTGVVLGALGASFIPVYQIKPSVWKPQLGLSRNKDESRALATKLFPKDEHRWKRKKDDGRAEAVLLAWFGIKYGLKSA